MVVSFHLKFWNTSRRKNIVLVDGKVGCARLRLTLLLDFPLEFILYNKMLSLIQTGAGG